MGEPWGGTSGCRWRGRCRNAGSRLFLAERQVVRKEWNLKRHIRRSLSFSNVVAVAALFFALGGTVYAAGKISGSQIKPKSIPGNRVKPRSLTGTQIRPGSLTGTQIKAGSLTGSQIKAGSLTGTQVNAATLKGVSATSLATVQYVSVPVPIAKEALAGTSGVATCPVGQKVIGGGAVVSNENYAFLNDSGPSADRSGWFATGYSALAGMSMTVTAICTPVTTPSG